MSNQESMSQNQAIKQVINQLQDPISIDEFVARVLKLWPSKAKNPGATIRKTLKWEAIGKSLIYMDKKTIAPISSALQGVTFRILLSRQEAQQGILQVYPAFTHFLTGDDAAAQVELFDASGQVIPTPIIPLEKTSDSIFGRSTYEVDAFDLNQWFRQRGVKRNDSLLITVLNWQKRQFRLAHEPAKVYKKRRREIQERNQQLADILFDMLENARDEDIRGSEAILTAYARLPDPTGYPGDHWLNVIDKDDRIQWDGYKITYPDKMSPFDRMFRDQEEPLVEEAAYTATEGEQVYRFKAYLKHRKGLWRRIDIQGKQTLGELDRLLRNAFEHDWDHMSGFWKLVRRGQSRRFREVDLGDLNPFGEGSAAEVAIAGLELEIGQELKYVYDFGDWIEHRLTLEAINEPETDIKYPYLVEQNKPRYRYCRHCKSKGRKQVATWICIECSNQEQTEVLACETCISEYHEDHHADEVLY